MSDAKSSSSADAVVSRAAKELREIRRLLKTLDGASCQVNLVKSRRSPILKNTRHLETTKTLADHLKEQIASSLESLIAEALSDHSGIGEFNFKAFAEGKIAVFPVSRVAAVEAWLNKIPADDLVQPFSPSDKHASQLRFTHTAITFASDDKKIRVFCKSGNAKLATRKLLASLLTGHRYEYVDPDKSVVLDTSVDFFQWDDLIFIVNYKKFESVLNFRDITRSVAEEVLETVLKLVPVTNADQVRDKVFSGARNLNKLASLKGAQHLPKLDISIIERVIKEKKLPMKLVTVRGKKTIEIDPEDPKQVKAYLEILGDDIVRSLLTGIDYIAEEKVAL